MIEPARQDNPADGPRRPSLAISRMALILLGLATFSAVAFFHLRGIGGDFLSDDFVHAKLMADRQAEGRLLDWLLERFYLPLGSGNLAYRPVVFVSYALDWLAHGRNAAGWHLTNLLIHLLNGVLIFLLGRRLARRAAPDVFFVPIACAALFLAIPFAGESTFWPVGRFDLLALLFSLAFLLFLLDDSGRPGFGRTVAALACLLLALLSKESAMPMLAVGFVLVFAFALDASRQPGARVSTMLAAALKESWVRYWPVFALMLAYFCWRYLLFGSAWKVYHSSHLPGSFTELFGRVAVLENVFSTPYGDGATVWTGLTVLLALFWLAGLPAAWKRASFLSVTLALLLACCFAGYLLAPATSFPIAAPTGEGIRNFYIPWAMFSLFAGMAVCFHRWRLPLVGLALVIALWGQFRLVTLWQDTAAEMLRITAGVPPVAQTIGDRDFALLLLPDHVGPVPFVRTAQGAVVMTPYQPEDWLFKMAAMTPSQFQEWEGHLAGNVIGGLKGEGVTFDRSRLVDVFCWLPAEGRFAPLGSRPRAGDAVAWEKQTLKVARQKGCLL